MDCPVRANFSLRRNANISDLLKWLKLTNFVGSPLEVEREAQVGVGSRGIDGLPIPASPSSGQCASSRWYVHPGDLLQVVLSLDQLRPAGQYRTWRCPARPLCADLPPH